VAVPLIPAQNVIAMRKQRSYPSGEPDTERISSFAFRYRHGMIHADDIPMWEREAVMVYLLEHPRTPRHE
jgi:hypothetical protein